MEGLQPCVGLQIVNTLCPGWEVAWESPGSWLSTDPTHFSRTISDWTTLLCLPLQPLPVPRVQQDLNGAWTSGHVQTHNIWYLTWDP